MSEIDQSALDTIRALQRPGAPDLLDSIIGVYADQTPEAVTAICEACSSGDLETVRTSAHALKSGAVYLGAAQFSKRLANLESAARENNLSLCRELITGLPEHSQQVLDELLALQDKAA